MADFVIDAGQTAEVPDGVYDTITVRGTWRFDRTADASIKVTTIVVKEDGIVDIGRPGDPVRGNVEIVIRDVPPTLHHHHLGMEADVGIICEGGTVYMHGVPKAPWVELNYPLAKGATQLNLPGVDGWQEDDRLWIPSLRQHDSWNSRGNPNYFRWDDEPDPNNLRQTRPVPVDYREYTIAEVGSSVTLDRPLVEDINPIFCDDDMVCGPIVANLSRNIVIRSENPHGNRGHIAFVGKASGCDIRWVEIRDMGRTIGRFQEVSKDAVPSVIGRYPIHMHHMHDSDTPRHWEGIVVDGGRVSKWGMVVHQTHYATVKQCIAYALHGAGIVCEDQNEFACEFHDNLAGNITAEHKDVRKGIDGDTSNPLRGFEGSGFWTTGFSEWIGNLAINCEHGFELPATTFIDAAKTIFGGNGRSLNTPIGMVEIPTATYQRCRAVSCEEGFEFWRAKETGTTTFIDCKVGNCRIAIDPNKEAAELSGVDIVGSPGDDATNGRGWQKNNGVIGVETNSAYTSNLTIISTRFRGLHCALYTARNFYFYGTSIKCQRGFDLGVRGNPELQWQTKTPPTAAPRFHNFPEIDCTHGNYIIEPSDEYPNELNESLPWMAYDESTKTWAFGGIDE